MNKVMAIHQNEHQIVNSNKFTQEQISILRNCICKELSNEEFQIFLMACNRTQLDPFMRQIHAVKRWDNRLKRETMTIQTGIDGYRLIAERTGCYAPGPKPTFEYDEKGNLISATAYVKKQTQDGTWHIVDVEAFFEEYCQTTTDKHTGEKKSIGLWVSMKRNQLAKCAESLALRKSFPAELSGIYTKEEMTQADIEEFIPKISLEQASKLSDILNECDIKYVDIFMKYIKREFKTDNFCDIPASFYEKMKTAALKNREETLFKKQSEINVIESIES